jgi:hypothetical protein
MTRQAISILALCAMLCTAASAQPAAAPKEIAAQLALPTVKAPRTRNGHPDFQGAWDRYPNILLGRFLPDQPKPGDPLATPMVQPPVRLKPKYQAIFDQRRKAAAEAAARGAPLAPRSVNCLPDGMPNVMRGALVMEILQSPEQINISQEVYNQTRRIYMAEPLPALDTLDPGYFGRSVGHFEGQVLIIETIGIREDIMATAGPPGSDAPHSPQLKIVERIRYVAPDVIQDHISIIDPEVLEEPWSWVVHFKRMAKDYRLQEYICEANRERINEFGVQQQEGR